MGTFKIPEDEPIASGMISKSLETAQKRIEGFNFDSRKQVLAYDDVLNSQRLSIYRDRRIALLGTLEEIDALIEEFIGEGEDTRKAISEKRVTIGAEIFGALCRRVILQVTDAYWLEHLESMEYLRRSVSLRAYGQRDPLIEYRREALIQFNHMQESIRNSILEALPRIEPADDARIRAEEERTRQALVAASEGDSSDTPKAPIVKEGVQYGRNDEVTIQKGGETQTLKFKKAEPLLSQGWSIIA